MKTLGGARLLRASLLQPLRDLGTITARLDCLDELLADESLFSNLSAVLAKFPRRMEHIVGQLAVRSKKRQGGDAARRIATLVEGVLQVKSALQMVPALALALEEVKRSSSNSKEAGTSLPKYPMSTFCKGDSLVSFLITPPSRHRVSGIGPPPLTNGQCPVFGPPGSMCGSRGVPCRWRISNVQTSQPPVVGTNRRRGERIYP
eukprot:9498519-Pyramimonas_sp.AAC.2